jgi:hypothetical protein
MLSPVMGARRSVFEIVRGMLSDCDDGGTNRTAIMYRSSLSYDQLSRYLSHLCGQGLIVARPGRLPDHAQGTGDFVPNIERDPNSERHRLIDGSIGREEGESSHICSAEQRY